jgi:hypothetical protein
MKYKNMPLKYRRIELEKLIADLVFSNASPELLESYKKQLFEVTEQMRKEKEEDNIRRQNFHEVNNSPKIFEDSKSEVPKEN